MLISMHSFVQVPVRIVCLRAACLLMPFVYPSQALDIALGVVIVTINAGLVLFFVCFILQDRLLRTARCAHFAWSCWHGQQPAS